MRTNIEKALKLATDSELILELNRRAQTHGVRFVMQIVPRVNPITLESAGSGTSNEGPMLWSVESVKKP